MEALSPLETERGQEQEARCFEQRREFGFRPFHLSPVHIFSSNPENIHTLHPTSFPRYGHILGMQKAKGTLLLMPCERLGS